MNSFSYIENLIYLIGYIVVLVIIVVVLLVDVRAANIADKCPLVLIDNIGFTIVTWS